ncbi:palmitoyltransferase ZDHHC19 [Sorex fumeus]|uniref:palmitoyltransferase ZDHHC19 n=1 Tax=Sorex fumeus TaxID=62283 RepID=UPI0024AD0FD4|nr:palmitoyltransferase ZDHHC19 [Sorex fumeus]
MPLLKEPHPPTPIQFSWILQSLFAAFNVVLLVMISGLFFAFPCRWLAQNGEQVFLIITGLLFLLTFSSLLFLNFSDPGILHQGSNEQGPMTVHVMWVNHRAFRLQWCQKCCFHRPPRTFHCPWCNICVEDFDHHCKWVNNCVGHRNFRFFMLLILSLCLYSGAVLTTSLIFLVRVAHLPFSIDKAMAILVAVPAAVSLVPVLVLLVLQVVSVSAGERSYEGKCRYIQGYNPFDHGCARNWYLAIFAPLGTKYMAEAVCLQRVAGAPSAPRQFPHFPSFPSTLSPPASSVTSSQPQSLSLQREGPQGSGEAATLQEIPIGGMATAEMGMASEEVAVAYFGAAVALKFNDAPAENTYLLQVSNLESALSVNRCRHGSNLSRADSGGPTLAGGKQIAPRGPEGPARGLARVQSREPDHLAPFFRALGPSRAGAARLRLASGCARTSARGRFPQAPPRGQAVLPEVTQAGRGGADYNRRLGAAVPSKGIAAAGGG